MKVLGHINGIAHHQRQPDPTDHPAMTAEGRRRIIATLIGQADWTASSIAEALAISEAVVNADLEQIGLDYAAPTTSVAAGGADLVRDGSGRFITETSTQSSPILAAYRTAQDGLTVLEAANIVGIEPRIASKRIGRLRKRGLLTYLDKADGSTVRRGNYNVYTIVDHAESD